MSVFDCKACKAKDEHINTLQHQIQTLEKLVFPPRATQDLSLEENNYNSDTTPNIIPEDEVSSEAAMFLSGNHDHIREEF